MVLFTNASMLVDNSLFNNYGKIYRPYRTETLSDFGYVVNRMSKLRQWDVDMETIHPETSLQRVGNQKITVK